MRKFSSMLSRSPPSLWVKLRAKSQVLSKAIDWFLQWQQTTFDSSCPVKKSHTTEFSRSRL